MPGGDGTGPWVEGSMTGRRMGYCSGSASPGYTNYTTWGGGRGYGRRAFGPPKFGRFFRFRPFRRGFFFGRGRW